MCVCVCVCVCVCTLVCWSVYILQAFNVISAVVKQRAEPGVTVQCRILEVRDTDVSHCHTDSCHHFLSISVCVPADSNGQAHGPWASAGAEFPGPAVDSQDQTGR